MIAVRRSSGSSATARFTVACISSDSTVASGVSEWLMRVATADDPARVIMIGSIDGIRVPVGDNFSYSASKAGLHGLTRALINNMVQGVTTGFEKELDIVGVGYRAEVKGKKEKNVLATLDQVQPVLALAQPVLGAPAHDPDAELHVGAQQLLQAQGARLAVDQGDVVDAEGVLHRGELEQVLEHRLGMEAVLDLDDQAKAVLAVGEVLHVGDALDLLVGGDLDMLRVVPEAEVRDLRLFIRREDLGRAELLQQRVQQDGARDHQVGAARIEALPGFVPFQASPVGLAAAA